MGTRGRALLPPDLPARPEGRCPPPPRPDPAPLPGLGPGVMVGWWL